MHGVMPGIDGYVAELDRALVGPRRVRRDLLAEVRDHLDDAAAAYRAAGESDAAAAQHAVGDFGAVETVAPEFQADLGLAQGRRTAVLTFAVILAQPLLWQDWPWFEGSPDQRGGGLATVADLAMESLGAVALCLCAMAVLACGAGTRYPLVRRVAARSTAVLGFGCAVTFPVLAVLVDAAGPFTTSYVWDAGFIALLLVLPLGLVAASARRCLRAC